MHRLPPAPLARTFLTAPAERREVEEDIHRRVVMQRVRSFVAAVVAAVDVGKAGEVAVLTDELLEDAGLALEDLAAQVTPASEEVLGGGRVDGGPHLASHLVASTGQRDRRNRFRPK